MNPMAFKFLQEFAYKYFLELYFVLNNIYMISCELFKLLSALKYLAMQDQS